MSDSKDGLAVLGGCFLGGLVIVIAATLSALLTGWVLSRMSAMWKK
jgi:hypothetical protein